MDVNGKLHALHQRLYSLEKESLEPTGQECDWEWGLFSDTVVQWNIPVYSLSTLTNYKELIISPLESSSTKCYNECYINTIYKAT